MDMEEPDATSFGILSGNLSASNQSLDIYTDDADSIIFLEEAFDSDLDAPDEAETWSELVDKKVQRRMPSKDIKRQDVIYELIQTEAAYVRTLHVMLKIYSNQCMMNELSMSSDEVNKIFPKLQELVDINGAFLKRLKSRQEESPNKCIECIGDILVETFGGESGDIIKEVYGTFCSLHSDAVNFYKSLLKTDKKFEVAMRRCMLLPRVRRLSIPECITYVTMRMTKYPLLIEAILKATKESKPDFLDLKESLRHVKTCLTGVDECVNVHEQMKELVKISESLDRKSIVKVDNVDYCATKLFNKRSKLELDKRTNIRDKTKLTEIRMVVTSEKIIFFQENNGKLSLIDGKVPVVPLKNLVIREVATDNKALYIISSTGTKPIMYEIVCETVFEKKDMNDKLNKVVKKCPAIAGTEG